METNQSISSSAFAEKGFKATIAELIEVIQDLYLSDPIPWIIGYSGGKDSTAIVQLIWMAVSRLEKSKQHKTVHVISTDTLVENPIVAQWVKHSLEVMRKSAEEQNLPILPHRLMPEVKDRFWVNLIGKGYPAPRPKFRWCTSRLKISPSNTFIKNLERQNGEAILVLGTRKQESAARAASMKRHEGSTRHLLNKHGDFDRCWVFTPVADWSNDDIWQFLMQEKNPWGYNNKDLLGMYQGATADGECPLVVDSNTPSCGDSRFGCYVCTMVAQDKSMKAMIQNDSEKEWMLPLLELRDKYLDTTNDTQHREFRRMDGRLTVMTLVRRPAENEPFVLFKFDDADQLLIETEMDDGTRAFAPYQPEVHHPLLEGKQPVIESKELENDKWNICYYKLVHGPYTQKYRELLLRKLLEAQRMVDLHAPEGIKFELFMDEDLEAIRREWVLEKHEIDDAVPRIYEEVFGCPYPFENLDDNQVFSAEDIRILNETASRLDTEDNLHFRLIREMLSVEMKYQHAARRAGLAQELNDVLEYGAFDNELEALNFAVRRKFASDKAAEKPVINAGYIIPIVQVSDESDEMQHAF